MEVAPDTVAALAAMAAERLRPEGAFPLLLVCEHAGAEVPEPWQNLGLDPAFLATHYAYDPGAADITRALSGALDAAAVLARWSRIFLDYNRNPGDWDQMRPDLGGIPVPGNLVITAEDRALRHSVAGLPLAGAIDTLAIGRRGIVTLHSFTPVMGGVWRDVDIGLLWHRDSPLVRLAAREMKARALGTGLRVGENVPYDGRIAIGHTLHAHGLERGLPALCFEFRNTLFSEPETCGKVMALMTGLMAALALRRDEWAGTAQ